MKRFTLAITVLALISGMAVAQSVPVEGAAGVRLRDLVGTPTLVTIVLKDSGAQVANLRIIELHSKHLTALNESNQRNAYVYTMISKVMVQGGKVEQRKFEANAVQALRPEHQQVLDEALLRAMELFQQMNYDQDERLMAAMLLAYYDEEEAILYLTELMESNDLPTRIAAAMALHIAGKEIPTEILKSGLQSGNRDARRRAAQLCGLTGYDEGTYLLTNMLHDRIPEIAAPAALALARLGNREIIPTLIEMLESKHEEKAQAAVHALIELGDADIIEQLKIHVNNRKGLLRLNVARVLYGLDDPMGKKLLLDIFKEEMTMKYEAADTLAPEQIWEASQYLRTQLERRTDVTLFNYMRKGNLAKTLFQSGDPTAISTFQQLLQLEQDELSVSILGHFIHINSKRLFPVLKPVLTSESPQVAGYACMAAVSLGNADFRERLLESSK